MPAKPFVRRRLDDGAIATGTLPEGAAELTLEEQLAQAQAELDELMAIPDWTPEQQARAAELTDLIAQLEAEIAAAQETAQEAAQLRARHAGRRHQLSQGQGRRTSAGPLNLSNPRERFEQDPMKGFKSPREFLMAVIDHGRGARKAPDKRLQYLAAGSDENRTNSDPEGGFLVPEGFSPTLLQVKPEDDPMGQYVTPIPMATPTVNIPSRVDKNHNTSVSGGLTVTRRPETVAGTPSRLSTENVKLEANGLFGLAYATEEILTDSPISFAALLTACFSEQFSGHIVNERINGSGIGEYLGVLNSACLVTVPKETGQAVGTIDYFNVVKMRARCWGYSNAIWLANHDTLPQLMLMNQAVGTGGYPVWQPSAREDAPDLLFGRPLKFTEYCKSVGTIGDLLLGNWSEFLEGTYQPLQSDESIHVRFVNHERTFKFWQRNAGQPWWKSALTPKNSAATLSPFVALETR